MDHNQNNNIYETKKDNRENQITVQTLVRSDFNKNSLRGMNDNLEAHSIFNKKLLIQPTNIRNQIVSQLLRWKWFYLQSLWHFWEKWASLMNIIKITDNDLDLICSILDRFPILQFLLFPIFSSSASPSDSKLSVHHTEISLNF